MDCPFLRFISANLLIRNYPYLHPTKVWYRRCQVRPTRRLQIVLQLHLYCIHFVGTVNDGSVF